MSNALEPSPFSTSATSSHVPSRRASVVVVVGNPQPSSRTRTVAERVARRIAEHTSAPDDILVIELADVGPALLQWGDPSVAQLKALACDAQAVVFASPTYKASFTGLLKLFLDQFDRDELAGVTTVPVMTGGSADHSLVVDGQLRPVLVEIGASLPTRGVYVWGHDLDEPDAAVDEWFAGARRALGRILWQ